MLLNLEGRGWVQNFLDLHDEEKAIQAQRAFGAPYLLTISQGTFDRAGKWVSGGNVNSGGTYVKSEATTLACELNRPGSPDVIWKAKITCQAEGSDLDAEKVAQQLVAAMIQDGVVAGVSR